MYHEEESLVVYIHSLILFFSLCLRNVYSEDEKETSFCSAGNQY